MAEKDFIIGSKIVAENTSTTTDTTVDNENTEITLFSFDKTLATAAEVTILATRGGENERSFIKGVLMHDGTTASFQKTSTIFMNDVPSGTIGTSWNLQVSDFRTNDSGTVNSIAFGNNLWAAGAGGYGGYASTAVDLRTSTDAITWTTRSVNITNVQNVDQGFTDYKIQSIAFGQNRWVLSAGHRLRTSTDAITWTTRTSTLSAGNYAAFNSIVFGNNLWVAGGNDNAAGGGYGATAGVIRTSTDAITWTTRTSNFGASTVNTIAYGNNLWVAGGYNGTIRTSTDAITWMTRAAGDIESKGYGFRSLAYNSDHGVWGATTNGGIFISKNLADWRQRDFYTFGEQIFNGTKIAYQDGMFIVTDAYGYVATSMDGGENWQPHTDGLGGVGNQYLGAIAYSATQSKWVVGGYGGLIKTSEGTPPTLKPIPFVFNPRIIGNNVVLQAYIYGATASPTTLKLVKQVLY
jgi:hypothetical protein